MIWDHLSMDWHIADNVFGDTCYDQVKNMTVDMSWVGNMILQPKRSQ